MRSWLKVGKILFGFLLTLYILVIAVLYIFQRDMLFIRIPKEIPTPAQAMVAEMAVVPVETEDGVVLQNWFAAPRASKLPVVIIFFGRSDVISTHARLARWLMDNGYGVLLANYRGYSGDPGQPSEENLYKDARASIGFVKAQGYAVSLMGISMGTGVAVRMATEYDVQSVVLFAPYSSVVEVAAASFPLVPVRYLMKDRFDNLSIIGQVKAPLLVVMGRLDQIVPFAQAEALLKAASEPKYSHWIDDAYHMKYRAEQYQPQVLGFLNTYAAGAVHENR